FAEELNGVVIDVDATYHATDEAPVGICEWPAVSAHANTVARQRRHYRHRIQAILSTNPPRHLLTVLPQDIVTGQHIFIPHLIERCSRRPVKGNAAGPGHAEYDDNCAPQHRTAFHFGGALIGGGCVGAGDAGVPLMMSKIGCCTRSCWVMLI